MPLFSYTTEAEDVTIERHYKAGEVPSKITVKGRIYWRDFAPRYARGKVTPSDGGYYLKSTTRGVPLSQKAEAEKLDAELGVPTEYEDRGPVTLPCYRDADHNRKWLIAHQWVNHDPGYKDPVPGDFVDR